MRYRYGAAAFKLDIAVHGGIPWASAAARTAGTLHVCGNLADVAAAEAQTFRGVMPERLFIIVAQQGVIGASRTIDDLQPIYAYAHVPQGFQVDATKQILRQIERFAPGFRECIAAVKAHSPHDLERANANNIGGDINGGSMDLRTFIARPRLSSDPYWLGADGFYLCSSSTPPGGGVHGMCGYLAARSALRRGDLSRDRYSAHGRFSLLEKLDGSVVVSPDGFVVVMRRRVGDGFEHPVGCRR